MVDSIEFTYQDFEDDKVFEYLYAINEPFKQAKAENRMARLAQDVGFKNFKKLFALYKRQQEESSKQIVLDRGTSDFGEQKI